METLSGALVGAIFDKCSMRDALHASYACHAWRHSLIPYLRETYSLQKYLLGPFRDPASLLRVFYSTGAVLSGGRALSYFLPRLRRLSPSSQDWDIFIPYPQYNVVHSEILSQGFQNIVRTKEQPDEARFTVYDYRNDENVKVQLVALTAEWSLFDCIMDFHTSVVQNGIAGWGCFSLNWEYTFADRGWFAERLTAYPEFLRKEEMKYAQKNITIVPWTAWEDCDLEKRKAFVVPWNSGGNTGIQSDVSVAVLKALLSSETASVAS